MPNRLAQETSPYLLQHQDNPVDWYPWGPEALERAREEDKPLLLSVGYSACHWCHVMERESFEDAETAAYMNEHFVNVKVDREERPDVDAIYMEAVQAISGHGGWPMTVFLDPDGVPFYGGTYFPPDDSRGMPSFRMVMEAVVHAFETQREEIRERAPGTRARLGAIGEVDPRPDLPAPAELEEAVRRLLGAADRRNGGFGGAPKFPPASSLELLLSRNEVQHVELTLDRMLAGGIYDQIGGGFSRYAVDAIWLVPHFEKMLYDNALLARVYLHAWQELGHQRYRRVCEETLDWMLREMRGPEGGFYSALDADSEGEEGKFYVWTPDQIRETLAADPNCIKFSSQQVENLMQFWGVSEEGNFEGANILHLAGGAEAPEPEGLTEARRALFEARSQRVWPGLDDKRLTSWNALAIAALADAGAVLGREDYLDAARACATFLLEQLRDTDGNLLRTYKDGRAHLNAYLEDHAFLLEALLALYEASFEERWFREAQALAEAMIARFGDPGARRLLLDLRRPRGADRPPQGGRRPSDPLRQQLGGDGASAPGGTDRRASLRRGRHGCLRPLRQTGRRTSRRLRPHAAGARLPPRFHPRGGAGGRAAGGAGRRHPREAAPPPGPCRRPRGCVRAAASRRPHPRRRQSSRLRLPELQLPAAGHGPGGAEASARGWVGSSRSRRG
jgi:uncharacterized protein YyaL (SSP411 family)